MDAGEAAGEDEWSEDLDSNAFGLNVGQDPRRLEYCAEPGVVRGGDGGTASHSEASLGLSRQTCSAGVA